MGQAKNRGTFEQRKAQAIQARRIKRPKINKVDDDYFYRLLMRKMFSKKSKKIVSVTD